MSEVSVGVLGASSPVGQRLLSMLAATGCKVIACSRKPGQRDTERISWCAPGKAGQEAQRIEHWISAAPLWVLPEYFAWLEAQGARRLVALSSTSRLSKMNSPDRDEVETAHRLQRAEEAVQAWAAERDLNCLILRPTLIYGLGDDKNIAEIARFIRRFGFFPVFGQARGLRQPIHADDVARACLAALRRPDLRNHVYNISGGETLTYRAMVERVFAALGTSARIVPLPLWLIRLAVTFLRRLPRYRHWTPYMAERMNVDLVFDHRDAVRDFGFAPQPFRLTTLDVAR